MHALLHARINACGDTACMHACMHALSLAARTPRCGPLLQAACVEQQSLSFSEIPYYHTYTLARRNHLII